MKEGVLRCHPDLAGKLAQTDRMSNESTAEQRGAGLLELTTAEREKLSQLNTSYKKKFSFPFIICVRQNKKVAIFENIEARLSNDRITELNAALAEVKKICSLRITDIINKFEQ